MFYFLIGFVGGLLISLLIITALIYFRRVIDHNTRRFENSIVSVSRPKGFIVEPDDPGTERRNRIMKENDKKGIDTKISDLYEDFEE